MKNVRFFRTLVRLQVAKREGMEDADVLSYGTDDGGDDDDVEESIWSKVGSAVGLGGKEKKKAKETKAQLEKNLIIIF